MNDLEKIFKTGLDDFEEVTPSKSLWWKLYASLLFMSIGKKFVLFIALFLLSVGVFFSINYIQHTQNSPQLSPILSATTTIIGTSDYSTMKPVNGKNLSQKTVTDDNTLPSKQISAKKSVEKSKSMVNYAIEKQKSYKPKSSEIIVAAKNSVEKQDLSITPISTEKNSISTSINFTEPEIISESQIAFQASLPYFFKEKSNFHPQRVVLLFAANTSTPQLFSHKIEAYAGPSISKEYLFSTNASYKNYQNYRLANETEKITPLLGLNYRIEYKNWFAMLGINSQQIKRSANYPLPVRVLDSILSYYSIVRMNYFYNIINYIPNPNKPSDSIPLYGLISNPDTTNYTETIYDTNLILQNFSATQKYSFIEIPLIIGRSFTYKKFVFETSLGISWARLSKYETTIVNLSCQNLMSEKETHALLVKNTFNGIIGVGAAYTFSKNKAVFIRPEFKFNLKNMFNSTFPVAEKNLLMNIAMGIRFDL